jgi:hypothetical protein
MSDKDFHGFCPPFGLFSPHSAENAVWHQRAAVV